MAIGDRRVHDVSRSALSGSRRDGRERFAWLVLLASFGVWLSLMITFPLAVYNFLHNATLPLVFMVESNEGTVGLEDENGRRPAILAGDPPQRVEGLESILTNNSDSALVAVYTPDESEILARLKINGNTHVEVLDARAPRFGMSDAQHELALAAAAGIVRINLPPRNGRSLALQVHTPQGGTVLLQHAGQYTLDVTNHETWILVQEGMARVEEGGRVLSLRADEGALMALQSPLQGPLSGNRNLVTNGDFNKNMDGWQPRAWEIEWPDQPEGEVQVADEAGEQVLRFRRLGTGHAEGSVLQLIEQDVSNFQALNLYLTLRIVNQSLPVCGAKGSECPLFVRIEYEDMYGVLHTWQQGFYAVGEPAVGVTPPFCIHCGRPGDTIHQRVPFNQLYFYESGNLLEKLSRQDIRPRVINSIILVSSGHAFEAQVFDVALMGHE
ncbi:MAG: hypothetical protein R3272_09005 [Candidatus Promineifilaceae bacterium]|nr:hypothetical protein [Candidatus Promineifilaceae bacterium]